MAMYHCNECQEFFDNDWHPGEEDPREKLELLCPTCVIEVNEKLESEE